MKAIKSRQQFPVRVLILAALLCFTGASRSRGALEWDHTTVLIKPGPEVSEIRAQYRLKNTGTQPVVLQRVESECTCMHAESDKSKLKPGQSATVTAVYTPGTKTGLKKERIAIFTDDLDRSVHILEFSVELPEVVGLNPAFIRWGDGTSREQAVVVETLQDNITIMAIFPGAGVAVEPKVNDPMRRLEMKVRLLGDGQKTRGVIQIQLNVGGKKRMVTLPYGP